MPQLPEDEAYLQRALELARQSAGMASPNPTVGCLLVRGDDVLGAGAHDYDAFDHAEIAALKHAGQRGLDLHGATAYVTLEPCSHHGRTGPCADALIAAGIARCVVAALDPNPQVSGSGLAKMRAAGIVVDVLNRASALAHEARRINDAFAFSITRGRPFVTLKAALSVDGMLAPPTALRKAGAPHWLTGEAARADVQHLRHAHDAILTGIGTVLADDPLLTDRSGLERRRPLLRVVLDSDLRTPLESAIVRSAQDDLLVVCHPFAPTEKETALRERGADVLRINGEAGRPQLDAVLEELDHRKLNSVMIESGTGVNGALLSANLVDKVVLYFAEAELGADAVGFATGGVSPYELQQRLTRLERQAYAHGSGEDVRVSGYLHDPWARAS